MRETSSGVNYSIVRDQRGLSCVHMRKLYSIVYICGLGFYMRLLDNEDYCFEKTKVRVVDEVLGLSLGLPCMPAA